ncbi:MAG: hypothetical protein WBN89_07750 [Prochlorococcaceae cyanobacterium]
MWTGTSAGWLSRGGTASHQCAERAHLVATEHIDIDEVTTGRAESEGVLKLLNQLRGEVFALARQTDRPPVVLAADLPAVEAIDLVSHPCWTGHLRSVSGADEFQGEQQQQARSPWRRRVLAWIHDSHDEERGSAGTTPDHQQERLFDQAPP